MPSKAITTVEAPEGQPSYFNKLLNGDLSVLSPEEQTAFYLERCRSIDVDPASQPFLFMQTKDNPPKTILYITRSATDQIGKREGLTETIVSREILNGIAIVVVRVTDGKRVVENIGAASFKFDYQAGDAIKRATTQGYRRAIIQFAGVGAVSEEDIDDIQGTQKLGMAGVRVNHTDHMTGEITTPAPPRQLTGRAATMPDTSGVRFPRQEEAQAAAAQATVQAPALDPDERLAGNQRYRDLVALISEARRFDASIPDPEPNMTVGAVKSWMALLHKVVADGEAQLLEPAEAG